MRPSRWSLSPVVPWEEDLDELIRLYGYGRRRKAEEDSGSSSGSSSEEYYNDSDSARWGLSRAALAGVTVRLTCLPSQEQEVHGDEQAESQERGVQAVEEDGIREARKRGGGGGGGGGGGQ